MRSFWCIEGTVKAGRTVRLSSAQTRQRRSGSAAAWARAGGSAPVVRGRCFWGGGQGKETSFRRPARQCGVARPGGRGRLCASRCDAMRPGSAAGCVAGARRPVAGGVGGAACAERAVRGRGVAAKPVQAGAPSSPQLVARLARSAGGLAWRAGASARLSRRWRPGESCQSGGHRMPSQPIAQDRCLNRFLWRGCGQNGILRKLAAAMVGCRREPVLPRRAPPHWSAPTAALSEGKQQRSPSCRSPFSTSRPPPSSLRWMR